MSTRCTASAVRHLLRAFAADPRHTCIPDVTSLLHDVTVRPERLTPANITDVYLPRLAQQHGAKLAPFDRRIPADAIDGGTEVSAQ
jgi:hypothetical protein